jgi:hypothetical protein
MTAFTFRPAERRDTNLLIFLAGGTSSGKTESAMRLATGLAGGKQFAVIDTEQGRALHKADDYDFAHAELGPPFTPERYAEIIREADEAGFPVIVIDSGSHEYESEGGLLDIQEAELERLSKGDVRLRQKMAPSSWQEPKARHRRHYLRALLTTRAHIVLCHRAQDKIEIVRVDGKTVVRPMQSLAGANGWVPICERRLPFEATASFLLLAERPGVPIPIKFDTKRHGEFVPLDEPLSEGVGVALAAWAAGPSSAPPDTRRKVLTPPSVAGAEKGQDAGAVVVAADDPPAPGPDVFLPEVPLPEVRELTEEDVAAAQEAAGFVVELPNKANWAHGLTLAEINAHERGQAFFSWALSDACPEGAIKDAAVAYARVRLPFMYEAAAA